MLKSRADSKLRQRSCFSALQRYVIYGPEFIKKTTLANDELSRITSEELLTKVRSLMDKQHEVLYYGPESESGLKKALAGHHAAGALEPLEKSRTATALTDKSEVYIAPYDAKQLYYIQYSNRGDKFDISADPEIELYNGYFGGGMNAIVFQEMREARSLAYSAQAGITEPRHTDTGYGYLAFIATQTDKLREAVEAFAEIIEHMPESETAFNIAKKALLIRMRTVRTVRDEVLWSYVEACDMGLKTDRNRYIYETIESMTLDDIRRTQEQWVRGRNYVFGILGDTRELDMEFLETLGPVQVLTQEELFGY